ncbi:MAG: nitrous oxide reductase accessory protein NosL [Ignavibacteria bacterium]|nr:nitrous oxide reductase accessory protein NosL [Ignavibacteria bacterium]
MVTIPRILMIAAAVLLAGLYVLPLWQISLEAPQYPEGIGMDIHIGKVVGAKQHDLESINGLNHYIGMKRIEPDSIPELRAMPFIVAGLIAFGLLAGFTGNRMLMLLWLIAFALLGVAGLYDFYMWEYHYGHDLDPRAIIKIPGMSYQPPLFGTEQILNFTASSYPGPGGIVAAVSALLGAAAWVLSRKSRRSRGEAGSRAHARVPDVPVVIVLLAGLALIAGCRSGPREIAFDKETCAHCAMTISDRRFASELVSKKGKMFTFDAIECAAAFIDGDDFDAEDVASVWTMDFSRPGTMIDGEKAWFLQSDSIPSPMGMHLAAFEKQAVCEQHRARLGGKSYRWIGLRLLVAKEWVH